MTGYSLDHRRDIAQCLLAKSAMLLVGHRVEQRTNPGRIVIQPEVCGSEDGCVLAPTLEQVGQDANHISRFLGVGSHEHLVFKQLQKVWCIGPRFHKLLALTLLLGRGHSEQAEVLRYVLPNERFNAGSRNLQTVVEQPMQQHVAEILLYALETAASLKINWH